jgi:hypothetical protein
MLPSLAVFGGGVVLTKTTNVFQELVNYVRGENGAWTAEFHGIIDVVVEGNTLERCRRLALDAFDQGLSAYLAANANSSSTKHAESRNG